MESTRQVLDHHLKCFGEGDLAGIMSDYVAGAVLFTPEGPRDGVDAIRSYFQQMLAEPTKPGVVFQMKEESVQGEYAYLLWSKGSPTAGYQAGTDTIVVREGKIVAQSMARWQSPTA